MAYELFSINYKSALFFIFIAELCDKERQEYYVDFA